MVDPLGQHGSAREVGDAGDAGDIGAVSFDLDGTLYDLDRARRPLLWATFPRWRTLRVGRRVREELRGRSFDSGEALLQEEARIAAERLDVDVDVARAHLHRVFNVSLTTVLHKVGPRAEARAVLEAIVARGLPIAVVSDRGHVREKLTALGLADLPWAALVSADDTGVLKPAAGLLTHTAGLLGVPTSRLLHVGDRDDADGAAARAAGARGLIIAENTVSPLSAVLMALGLSSSTGSPTR